VCTDGGLNLDYTIKTISIKSEFLEWATTLIGLFMSIYRGEVGLTPDLGILEWVLEAIDVIEDLPT